MSRAHRTTASRPVRPAHLPLRGPGDAIDILCTGRDTAEPGVVALLLDAQHRGLTHLEVAGRGSPDAMLDVADAVVAAAGGDTALAAVVLASFRPGRAPLPDPAEISRFDELRDLFDDAGIDLVDWFLLTESGATSMAELGNSPSRWRT